MRINHRGNLAPPRAETASVMTTGSQISPRKELGNPRRFDCHETPTFPQEMTELMLQLKEEFGFLANLIASMERTSEAEMDINEETSIVQ